MWLIAGLGNPGRRYQGTRHNIGFDVIDELCKRHMQGSHQTKFGGEVITGLINNKHKVILLKPMEFMNNSGFALQRAAQFYDVSINETLVIHDELDLPEAKLRLKSGGGHGGNNGLRSVIAQCGSKDFLRIRIGIGKPNSADGFEKSTVDHVLSTFPPALQREMDFAVQKAADAAEAILDKGMTAAMNDFNGVSPN